MDTATGRTRRSVTYGVNVSAQSNVICRALWVILLLGFMTYFMYVLFYRFEKMKAYPVTSRTSVVDLREVDFPAMTLCNMNHIKLSYVDADEFIKNVYNAHNAHSGNRNQVNLSDPEVIAKLDNEYSLRQVYKDGAFTLKEMLLRCFVKTIRVDCSTYFTSTLTHMGHCYTFNSADVIKQRGQLKTRQTGVEHGINLFVNVAQADYFYQTGQSAGIKIMVHDPNDWPQIEAHGVAIAPGTETFLSVGQFMVKKMPPPYGGHTRFDTTSVHFKNHLKYFDGYSKSRCIQECYMNYTITQCGCVEYILTIENSTFPDCTYSQFERCIKPAKDYYLANIDPLSGCSCEDTCIKRSYTITKSEASFPSQKKSADYQAIFPHIKDNPSDYFRQNFLVIKLFMGELSYTLYEEEAAFSAGDFQSDVGGNLGLCLGASFLSIAELAEFLLIGLLGLACKISKKKQMTTPANNH